MNCKILIGDCREVLKTLADTSIDSCVTDPPYDLTANKKGGSGVASVNLESPYGRARIGTGNGKGGFMGLAWDSTGVAFDPATWREVFRVLKPGAHLLAFGGTRTYHRMACAIEDAGFEIRDQMAWAYGSGFPKSLDVAKAIDKAAGAEREVVGKYQPPNGQAWNLAQAESADVAAAPGTFTASGRRTLDITAPATDAAKQWDGWGTALKPAWEPICVARKPLIGTVADNVQAHGTGALNIDGCRIDAGEGRPLRTLDAKDTNNNAYAGRMDGSLAGGSKADGETKLGRWPANLIHDGSEEVIALFPYVESGAPGIMRKGTNDGACYGAESRPPGTQMTGFGDGGSAARFFYCAKVSPSERGESEHPTMKPLALMRYLVRLVTPPGGMTLDLFGGSGTTAVAAIEEGFRITIIEQDPKNAALIHSRTDITPGFAL